MDTAGDAAGNSPDPAGGSNDAADDLGFMASIDAAVDSLFTSPLPINSDKDDELPLATLSPAKIAKKRAPVLTREKPRLYKNPVFKIKVEKPENEQVRSETSKSEAKIQQNQRVPARKKNKNRPTKHHSTDSNYRAKMLRDQISSKFRCFCEKCGTHT